MSNKQVPAVYRTIISDTITSIRPDFDALGVEEAVLQELLRLWELKLAQSRAADFTGDERMREVARGFLPRGPGEGVQVAAPVKKEKDTKPKKEGSGAADGGDDEDAINSDLDDDDELDEEDDAEGAAEGGDLVIALYEKVQRVKNKWKVTLKDGLVSVNGKEYLFAKCQGEFEW